MSRPRIISTLALLTLLVGVGHLVHAAPLGTAFSYQGQLTAAGAPANGNYDLVVALFDDPTFGSQVGGTVINLNVAVSNGLFTTAIDFGAGIFNGTAYWLAIGVRSNSSGTGFTALTPRQPLNPSPYALYATVAPVADGAVTSAKILDGTIATADLANSAVTSAKIADGTIANADLANDAVTSAKILDGTILGADVANNTIGSAQLADSIDLGTTNVTGLLNVYRTTSGTPSISLFGNSSQISTYGADGEEQIRLWGTSYGEILLHDSGTNNRTAAVLSANATAGGYLYLYQGDSTATGLRAYGDNLGGGRVLGYNSSNSVSLDLRAQFDSATPAAWLGLYDQGSERVSFEARNGTSGVGGLIDVKNDNALNTIRLIGDAGTGDSRFEMYAGGTNLSFRVLADDSSSGSSAYLFNGSGQTRVEIDSDDGDNGAVIRLYGADGGAGLLLDAESSNAGYLAVYGTNGAQRIILDGQSPDGNGRITTDELRTTGNVGIGRTPAANILEVEGNASKAAAGSWLANSDARIKTDIETVQGALDALAKVRLVSFHYTPEYRQAHPSVADRRYLNVVAQEFREVFPDEVKSSGERMADGSEILQVDTYPLTIYSAAAIQELNQKLQAELKRRDVENGELKQRLEKLERLVSEKN